MPSPRVSHLARVTAFGRPDVLRNCSFRNLCVLACLGTCLFVSVVNLFVHVARRAAGIETLPADAASYSGGVLSDPSDHIISLEQQIGIVQPRGDNITAADVAGVLPQLLEQVALGQTGAQGPLKRSETAICLSGAAGDFEATGPSTLKFLLKSYQPADLFLHLPLDENSAKIWILSRAGAGELGNVRVAGIRIFPNSEVEEAKYSQGKLENGNSLGGVQDLLQYFRLVEGCLVMVSKFEKQTGGGEYRWVVRARLDSYWSAAPPELLSFQRNKYAIPYGNDKDGLNDRLGIGSRGPSTVAMRRLSFLKQILMGKQHGSSKSLSPERELLLQLRMRRVRVTRRHFPFCTLSRGPSLPLHSPSLTQPQSQCSPVVPSLASDLPMDGTDCMPCEACSRRLPKTEMEALFHTMHLKRERGQYQGSDRIQACNLTGAWEDGVWQERFNAAAGAELAKERQSTVDTIKDRASCIRNLNLLRFRTADWDAPPPEAVCARSALGPAVAVGEGGGVFPTLTSLVSSSSLVVSSGGPGWRAGIAPRGDRSWEMGLRRMVGAKVVTWGETEFNLSDAALAALSTDTIDALKFATDGSDLALLDSFLNKWKGKVVPVCQLLVSFPKKATEPMPLVGLDPKSSHGIKPVQAYAAYLQSGGLHLESCVGGRAGPVERCMFYSLSRCR